MKTGLLLAALAAGIASSANAAQVRLVTENGGNSWTFGSQYVTLIGARDVASAGTTLFYQDILDMVVSGSGNIVGIYNGINDASLPVNTGDVTYGSGDADPANGIEEFVSAQFNTTGRHVGVFYVVHTGTVVWRNPFGTQTNTAGTNGALGEFGGTFGVAVVPLPPAAFAGLGLLGAMGGVAAVKRRRAR